MANDLAELYRGFPTPAPSIARAPAPSGTAGSDPFRDEGRTGMAAGDRVGDGAPGPLRRYEPATHGRTAGHGGARRTHPAASAGGDRSDRRAVPGDGARARVLEWRDHIPATADATTDTAATTPPRPAADRANRHRGGGDWRDNDDYGRPLLRPGHRPPRWQGGRAPASVMVQASLEARDGDPDAVVRRYRLTDPVDIERIHAMRRR